MIAYVRNTAVLRAVKALQRKKKVSGIWMKTTKHPELWARYNNTLAVLAKSTASKTSGGQEREYGHAALQLMRAGEMYKIKAKYRAK